jgi:DNA-binding PadR family transcriptional regulator
VAFFRYGELPLVLLALLKQRSMNGYETLAELGRLFAPEYSPSPGSVYPAISALVKAGLISSDDHSGARTYLVTPEGERALEVRAGQLAAIEARTGVFVTGRPQLQVELTNLATALTEAASRVDSNQLLRIVRGARQRIEALAEKEDKP